MSRSRASGLFDRSLKSAGVVRRLLSPIEQVHRKIILSQSILRVWTAWSNGRNYSSVTPQSSCTVRNLPRRGVTLQQEPYSPPPYCTVQNIFNT